jgi:acyl transferase domain-containing protein
MSDIAIVGIDCKFPGAPDPAALWQLLMKGEDAIGHIPDQRWAVDAVYRPHGHGMNTREAGLIDNPSAFDHAFFGIPPNEARMMDPQQRLVLQVTWRALEDATLDPRALAGSSTAVYVGVMGNEWSHLHMTDYPNISPQHGTGNGYCMIANRISYQLDLHGPSLAIDTACSSSLVACLMACNTLRAGDCDLAIVAGVNAILTPALHIFYNQAGLSATDGRCRPFSRDAHGIGRGEGVGVLVLQRLDDAVRDGLPMYATIKGGAINHDGRSNGITAPSRWAQRTVLKQAYEHAGVNAHAISFIEAHGTGTLLGDMIEANALGDVHGGIARNFAP